MYSVSLSAFNAYDAFVSFGHLPDLPRSFWWPALARRPACVLWYHPRRTCKHRFMTRCPAAGDGSGEAQSLTRRPWILLGSFMPYPGHLHSDCLWRSERDLSGMPPYSLKGKWRLFFRKNFNSASRLRLPTTRRKLPSNSRGLNPQGSSHCTWRRRH